MKLPPMTDMRRTPEEKTESAPTPAVLDQPDYPWGLRICLTEAELDKLNLGEASEEQIELGDIIHLQGFAVVTSISRQEVEGSKTCRVELQITHLSGEDEDEEGEEEEKEPVTSKLYSHG